MLDILKDLVGSAHSGTIKKEDGVSVSHSGMPGAVLARMFVSEESTGFSSVVNFIDSQASASSKWNGSGYRVGKIDGEDLTPVVVARNAGGESSVVGGRLSYTNDAGEVVFVNVPAIRLAANETKSIDVERAIRQSSVPANITNAGFEFEYSTAPGSVVMTALSVSRSGNQVFQIPLFDPNKMGSSAGGYPWKASGDYKTILYIKNETDQPQKYTASLLYEGGDYTLGIRDIKPHQLVAIDFRALRDAQTADANGHIIPLNVERGQIGWSSHGKTNRALSGRSHQSSVAEGVSSTYDCRNCCPNSIYDGWITPGETINEVGDVANFIANQRDVNCYGQIYPPHYADFVNWESADPNIASTRYYDGQTTSLDVGETTIQASWTADSWFEGLTHQCEYTPVSMQPESNIDSRPKISEITPDRSVVNRTVDVTINGNGFATGATIQVSGSGVTVSNVSFVSASKITAKFTIAANAAQGERDVTVTVNTKPSKTKKFLVQVPDRLEVIADTGNVGVPNCSPTVRRQVTYKLIDQDNKEIRQAVEVNEDLSNVSANSCNNGLPMASSCAPTDPPPQQGQAYRFTDSISVNFTCSSPVALQNCQSNSSCGYTYTQKWKTCGNDGSTQLFNVSGATLCNQIKLDNSTQFSAGTRPPN